MTPSLLIPTKGRPAKLLRCLRSIPTFTEVKLHATCQSDLPPLSDLPKGLKIDVSFGPETVVQSFNLLASRTLGDVFLACDDVEFLPGCLEAAHAHLNSLSPRHLVGLKAINISSNDDAFCLVGRGLIDQRGFLFRSEFEHFFADTELGSYAKQRGLFSQCKEARMLNHHPDFSGEYDHTHNYRRREKWLHDKAVWDEIRGSAPAPQSPTG